MIALVQIPINFSALNKPHGALNRRLVSSGVKLLRPIYCSTHSSTRTVSFSRKWSKLGDFKERSSFSTIKRARSGIVVKFRDGFGFDEIGDGGGGGGGGSNNSRVLVNLGLAIGLTYLTMTGQLGWILDAIVSVWLLAVLLPIVGLGALFWWAGRDILQGTCPNCGNDFQVLKSTLNDDVQLCPFCTQPFSVVGDKFVKDPVKFSNQSTTFGQAFNNFSTRSKKGTDASVTIVDVEAEVTDIE